MRKGACLVDLFRRLTALSAHRWLDNSSTNCSSLYRTNKKKVLHNLLDEQTIQHTMKSKQASAQSVYVSHYAYLGFIC